MRNLRWVLLVLLISLFSNELKLADCGNDNDADPNAQQNADKVSKLPGQGFSVSFEHYSGFITVNEEAGRALFYWFFEAAEDPASKPVVIWLNGGPGCSSIAYGVGEELGPFHVEKDGKSLYPNPYSWNLAANMLFLDSPVGVGYSYSNTSSDHTTNGDKRTAADSLTFVVKWFERFPQYKGRELYIVGESYGGHYVPQLSQAIVHYNSAKNETIINFKGFMVGNALFDTHYDHVGVFLYLWSSGLISDQTFQQLNQLCDYDSFISPSEPCNNTLDIANREIGNIDQYSLFTPACTDNFSILKRILSRRPNNARKISREYDPCTADYATVYFNLLEVQRALHVHDRGTSFTWQPCNMDVYNTWKDSPASVLDIYHELLQVGVRIWVFSGDTDTVLPVTSTRMSVAALNLPTVGPWRPWYDEEGQVSGWTQQYEKGLNFVTVRGAGHEVPLHRPKQALTLFKSFISGSALPELELMTDA
ncbi:OLC1v1035419C1 [Oldenlandia corymbosa var. corymbosa]|uniref:Carboxypeptidase n=1 Tax=Oldenlandia corymbosa var. corymbosa TaxID=529605 RepID=A0AAV1CT06_OLDCO|nr:OLC1v1035419C1 [Oldenlandia corymbosa var. corymbosa]